MNILDINDADIPAITTTWIDSIFDKQEALHAEYSRIEVIAGIGLALIAGRNWSIDDKYCQYILKDYAWRVTEEITEANTAHSDAHRIEELIDAVHFYAELLIMAELRAEAVTAILAAEYNELDDAFYMSPLYVINQLGCAMNTLKQKPWKQHHFPTDRALFKKHIIDGFCGLIQLLRCNEDLSTDEIHAFYHKKSLVNNFRINSNY